MLRCPHAGIPQLTPGALAPGSLIPKVGSTRNSFYGNGAANPEEDEMAWKTPKIVELPVGMEINMYACATHR